MEKARERKGRLEPPKKQLPQKAPPAVDAPVTPAHALQKLAETWPQDIESRAVALAAVHEQYRQEFAAQFEPIFNQRILEAIRNKTSYDTKKELIKQFNEEMRLGGVAVRCEVKDDDDNVIGVYPGYLAIGTARNEEGRFRVEWQEAGQRVSFGFSEESPPLELMAVSPQHSREVAGPSSGKFTERLSAKRSTPGKKSPH